MKERFSSRTQELANDPGATAWDTQSAAVTMQERGVEVIFLTVGDPDFATPAGVVEEAIAALHHGRTRYSPVAGELQLRTAVAAWEGRRLGTSVDPSTVTICPGAQNALFNVMQCLIEKGDSVIMADPFYATYPGIVTAAGGTVRTVPTRSTNGFAIDPEQVHRALDSTTKVLLVNSPANPTGCILPRSVLEELAAMCSQEGLWLVSDEVYSQFAYGQHAFSAAEAGADMSRTVIINSVSKTLAMTGWRIGWAITPLDLAQHLEALMTAQLFGIPQFLQDAAAWALQREHPEVARMRLIYEQRRDCVIEALKGEPGIRCVTPEGGMFVMVDVAGVEEDSRRFAFELLNQEHVAVVPGHGFGESTRGCIRISLTQPAEVLREACRRIARFSKTLRHEPESTGPFCAS